jgi:hypothetical protein
MNDAAQIRFTPDTVINRRISGPSQRLLGDQPVDRGDLSVHERDLAQTRVD